MNNKRSDAIRRLSVFLCAVLMTCFHGLSYAQNVRFDIKGVVIDEQGEPLIGASVFVKGTTEGVVTDMDGAFALSVQGGGNLNSLIYRISLQGYRGRQQR